MLALLLASAPAAAADWRAIQFTANGGDVVPAEAASVVVHERHADPASPSITLPVIRFRSTAANPGPPIIDLAGGPGDSGLERAKQELFPTLMRLRAYADVVVFDQRGTGAASPSLLLAGNYDLPPDRPLGDPATVARLTSIAAAGAAELRRRGVNLAAYNSAESAEDIEELRRTLGAERVVILGHSYGSHLGLAYLSAHPDHVSAAILSGVNDLGNRWRLPSDGDAWLARVDAAIRADPRLAQRMPDFLGLVRRVMAELARAPRQVRAGTATIYVGREELQTLLALNAGNIFFVRELPLLFARMGQGDFGRVADLLRQLRATPQGTAMRHAMHIASGVSPARMAQIGAEAPDALSGDGINFPYNVRAFTEGWHVTDLGEHFRAPPRSTVPVLFLNGEFDGRTSTREARETAARFPRGAFAEVTGVAHDFYSLTPLASDAMLAFLRDGTPPPPRLTGLAMEFRSPDEPELLAALQNEYRRGGIAAAIALMEERAGAASGPLFNVSTARVFGGILVQGSAPVADSIRYTEAADRLFPNDFLLNRQLATLYRNSGDIPRAVERLETLRRLDPVAPVIEHELAQLRAAAH